MIKREHYLNQIIDLIDKDIIKILTGVRQFWQICIVTTGC